MLASSVKRNIQLILANIVRVSVVVYLAYHMFGGARGLLSWAQLQQEMESLEQQLKDLKRENALLENKIKGIRGDNLDLDLLEEQAYSVLGFFHPDDLIVLLPKG